VLGDRSAAGRRVLAPLTRVQILLPQPFLFLNRMSGVSYKIAIRLWLLKRRQPRCIKSRIDFINGPIV
jgi:hypothetical protein